MEGGLCNDASEVIRSQVQCTNALQKLGYQPLSGWWTGVYSSTIPAGCSVRGGRNDPHFEESSNAPPKEKDLSSSSPERYTSVKNVSL